MNFLIVIVVILGVAAIAQAVRVYELAKKLSNRREEDISIADNNLNANLWLLVCAAIVVSFFYLVFRYKDAMLPTAASEHGVALDTLFAFNLYLVSAIFIIFNIMLMVFAWRYRYRLGERAFYYPHNDKLELVWTVIPAITMAIIIIYGLNVWWDITDRDDVVPEEQMVVQLYSKQFDWTARYAGADRQLGETSFNFITGSNPLGIINSEVYDQVIADIDAQVEMEMTSIANEILPDNVLEEKEAKIERLKRHKIRVLGFDRENANYAFGNDDIVMDKGVFYLPKGREVLFEINSRDVIHSAFIPHLRMQMNAVPGMTTTFKLTPTITTEEMRQDLGDAEFDYVLLCNKICGAAHYNMKMTLKVVEESEFQQWLSQQKTFVQPDTPEAEVVAEVTTGK